MKTARDVTDARAALAKCHVLGIGTHCKGGRHFEDHAPECRDLQYKCSDVGRRGTR
jgi:hypothetical protein